MLYLRAVSFSLTRRRPRVNSSFGEPRFRARMQTGLFPDISVYAAKRDLLFGNGTALKGFSLYVIILKNKSEFVKEIYNMKKVCLVVLPALTIVLELLPVGAVCIFATSPIERVKATFSYFSLTPFGYANFAPFITATLTVAIFLLSVFSLKKDSILKALFVLSIITVVISLLPLMYGLNYYTLVGAIITVTLVIESILAKILQK